jgi:hypothetical protein
MLDDITYKKYGVVLLLRSLSSHLLWNPEVHYCVHRNSPLGPNLKQMNL